MIEANDGMYRLHGVFMDMMTDVVCHQRMTGKPISQAELVDIGYEARMIDMFVKYSPILDLENSPEPNYVDEDTTILARYIFCEKCDEFLIASETITCYFQEKITMCENCDKKTEMVEGLN